MHTMLCDGRTVNALTARRLPSRSAISSSEVAGWLYLELPGLRVVGPSDRHLGWSGRHLPAASEGVQPPPALELSARPAFSHPPVLTLCCSSRAQVQRIYRVARPWWPPPTTPAVQAVWGATASRGRRARPEDEPARAFRLCGDFRPPPAPTCMCG